MPQTMESVRALYDLDIEMLPEQVDSFRIGVTEQLDKGQRAELGQFMTPLPVARFMASMFTRPHHTSIRLLDAGAGVGSLSAAFVAKVCGRRRKPQELSVTAYEIDPLLAAYLEETLEACCRICAGAGIRFSGEVLREDFIDAGSVMLQDDLFSVPKRRFDCAILNPPYHKIRSDSQHRKLLRRIGIETSNLYTAFLAITSKLLDAGGELVAITPRSFCNGPYFRHFRRSFFQAMSLQRIHIFESRNSAFRDDEVLQENVIFHAARAARKPATVTISSSADPEDARPLARQVAYEQVIQPDDPDLFIHIVTDEHGHQVAERMSGFTASLKDLGITVSTGRVVDFRAKDFLCADPEDKTVPLIYPRNFSDGFIKWPVPNGKKAKALLNVPETQNLLVPSETYVLVKRFSAKEEPRRVVAAIYDPDRVKTAEVGFENHLNYYHIKGRGLPENLAAGLAAFLNSTLVDSYFRLFNGHTQVNATDLRKLTYPTRSQLETLGKEVGSAFLEQGALDNLIEKVLR